MKIEQIIAMRNVSRWHTRAHNRPQSVAEHCALVALIALELAPMGMDVRERFQLVQTALVHDAHEADFGDIPYPAKVKLAEAGFDIDTYLQTEFWGCEVLAMVSPLCRDVLHVADVLEAALYARDHVPEIAADVRQQALDTAKKLFGAEPKGSANGVVYTRVCQILGEA